ncbi:MAG: hypothetical protein KJZ83_23910 [Burkholderiaceae bacterium]|nr:hypothetical protein [Burkholderiaceae bacterium]
MKNLSPHWHAFRCVHPDHRFDLLELLDARDEIARKGAPPWAHAVLEHEFRRLARFQPAHKGAI